MGPRQSTPHPEVLFTSTQHACYQRPVSVQLVDFIPGDYDRKTMDEAIAAVPAALVSDGPLLWGSTEQVVGKLRAFGDAGLRHVVLSPVSGLVSKRAALYGLWATGRIARSLRSDPDG